MLDPEFKKEWVAALRSGKYQQGQGVLCQLDGNGEKRFCCLGVALDLKGAEWVQGGWRLRGYLGDQGYCAKFVPESTWNRYRALKEQGLGHYLTLMEMNDGADGARGEGSKSFDEIADYIEENL